MAVGTRILERLESEGYLGPDGGIEKLARRIDSAFDTLAEKLPGVITARSGLGAMQAFVAWTGDPEITRLLVDTCLDEGVLFQTAGSDPMKVRLLPPLSLTEAELDAGFAALERALRRVARATGRTTKSEVLKSALRRI
jgi:4-aminobutyrate aminotransferase-like enzyme